MKWFKHDTNALHDAKIEKLIMKYGIEGYGLYFACVEMIAGNLTNENVTFELEHDSEILAYKFKIDTVKVEEMMLYMVNLGLFELNDISGRIICTKIVSRLDSSLIKNPKIKELKEKTREVSRSSEKSTAILDDTILYNTIIDKDNKRAVKEMKIEYGSLDNVMIKYTNMVKLKNDYGAETINLYVERLSLYIPNRQGKPYKDHNAVIRSWLNKDGVNKVVTSKPQKEVDYEPMEFLNEETK